MLESLPPHEVICFGEILWDVLPGGSFPGGAPLNVTYHLHKLGGHPALISRVGLDQPGKKLINLVDGYGLTTEYFQLDHDWPTGKVLASLHEDNDIQYDIIKPVAWDYIQWEDSFPDVVSKAHYFVFGSLVTRHATSRNTLYRLMEAAKRRVLDVNLRPPFYTRDILEKLLTGLHLLKVNSHELELLTGWFAPFSSDTDRMQILQDRFHIPFIVVTKGSKGAVMLAEGHLFHHPGYSVAVADTVGSGDAFLAGLLTKLLEEDPPAEALRFANATGAVVAAQKGGCPEYITQDIDLIMH